MTSEVARFVRRLLALFRRGAAETELSREITAHLQLLEDQFVDAGMSRDDARYAARRAFGGVEQAKEHQRDARTFRWLTGWSIDLKLGIRMLVKTPGLTVVAIVALAVAIGAGAAYLEFTRDLLNPSLPIANGDRIVGISVWDAKRHAREPRAMHDFAVWRAHATSIDDIGAERDTSGPLTTDKGRTERVRGVEISAVAFRLFPTRPLLGRTLTEDDEKPDSPPVVIIGHELWRARFGSDPNIVGRNVRIGATVHAVVGVMPQQFGFPANHNLWIPLKAPTVGISRGEGPAVRMFGRLRLGITAETAQAELQRLLIDSSSAGGEAAGSVRADVRPYVQSLSADARGLNILHAVNLLFVGLLVVCGANVATLVFARTAMRETEITVRTALGASRGRICAQLFAEALVLSCLAALVGLGAARLIGLWATQLFTDALGPMPFWWNDALSIETVLYAFALAVFAALIVGVIPALKATTAHLQARLHEAGASASSMKLGRLWTAVMVIQAAVAVLFCATVLSLGWTALRGQYDFDVTYPREHFLTARLGGEELSAGGQSRLTAETLQSITVRLKNDPEFVNATYATAVPGTTFEQFHLEFGAPEAIVGAKFVTDTPWCQGARVGLNFFETLGIPLVAGRLFTDADILGGHNVAIVDESFVRVILGGRNALGLMVRQPSLAPGTQPGPWHEIVGVVRDVTVMRRKKPHDAVLYRPAGTGESPLRALVRTYAPASTLTQRLEAIGDAQVADVTSLDRLAKAETFTTHLFLRVFVVVAAIALLLSTAGIYALISFTLARRTREIAIRVALGAAPRRIITGVFSRAFRQIGIGLLIGAIPGTVVLSSGADDAGRMGLATASAAMLAVGAFVILVAAVSCVGPLRRALQVEPTQALRGDG